MPPAIFALLEIVPVPYALCLRVYAFGAHCSNSLHGFSNNNKYVTSYFCIFFFFVFLCGVVADLELAALLDEALLFFFAVGAAFVDFG